LWLALSVMSSYPTKAFRRTALAPGILAAILLLAGLALLDSSSYYYWFKVLIAVLAAIVGVFAWQAKQWWWLPPLAVIVVAWNPIWPIDFHHWIGWLIAQYIAAVLFLVIGVLVKVPNEDDRNRRQQPARKR
jgi:hypothetical protein